MRLRGLTLTDFTASVARVNASTSPDGVTYAGNLATDASETGKRVPTVVGVLTVNSRKGPGATRYGACWHAYRDVIADILAHHPDVIITTGLARYDAATFADVYPTTDPNRVMRDRCDCEAGR